MCRLPKFLKRKSFLLSFLTFILVITALVVGLLLALKQSVVGAVAANGRGCAEIGGQMLEDGGSAVDAAIATLLCEGIMLPQSLGIGGGFVATIYTKETGKIETVIARESAPAAATEDMFSGTSKISGPLTVAVPGELLGYWEMHKRHGVLTWEKLFEPAIKLCTKGHWVSKFLASSIKSYEAVLRRESTMAEVFLREDGSPYEEGDHIKRSQLGKSLKIIAEKGVGVFYGGGILGKMFVEDIKAMGGIITEDDLKNYKVQWEISDHVVANITDKYTVYTTPLPTSGVILAFILNVINDLYTDDRDIYWQRVIESFKHAYGSRANLGDLKNDPQKADTIKKAYDDILSQSFVDQVRQLIHDDKTSQDFKYYGANFLNKEHEDGTANVAVLAPNGDAICITSTINNKFGAKLRSAQTGIVLNDEMDDFSTPGVVNSYGVPASPANFIYPGKRPMSSMCPSIILDKDGDVRMLVGAAGGTKITTSVATAIIKYLIFEDPLKAAIDNGRLHHQLAPMRVDAEPEVSESVRYYLQSVGHKMNILPKGSGFAALTAIGARLDVEPYFDRRRGGSIATIMGKAPTENLP